VVAKASTTTTIRVEGVAGTDANPGTPPLRLAATGPGALAIAPGVAGAPPPPGVPKPPAPGAAAAGESVKLALSGPSQAAIGQEFVVSLNLPARNQGANSTIELSYDPTVLNASGGQSAAPVAPGAPPPPDPGRVLINVTGPAVAGAPPVATPVRFRVVAKAPTTTTIRVEGVAGTDAAGSQLTVGVPGPLSVSVVGAPETR